MVYVHVYDILFMYEYNNHIQLTLAVVTGQGYLVVWDRQMQDNLAAHQHGYIASGAEIVPQNSPHKVALFKDIEYSYLLNQKASEEPATVRTILLRAHEEMRCHVTLMRRKGQGSQ